MPCLLAVASRYYHNSLSGANPVTEYSSTVLMMAGFILEKASYMIATLPMFLNFVTKVISAFLVEMKTEHHVGWIYYTVPELISCVILLWEQR